MGQASPEVTPPSSDDIRRHIEQTRSSLGTDLDELETRVRSVTDWRARFRERPGSLMALAFGGGLLLAMLTGGDSE